MVEYGNNTNVFSEQIFREESDPVVLLFSVHKFIQQRKCFHETDPARLL